MAALQRHVLRAAFATLEAAGVRWRANAERRGGNVRLANLIAYGDQSRIHDALVDRASVTSLSLAGRGVR